MAKIVIFGATSAFASAAARIWISRGESLFLVGREPAKLQALIEDLRERKVGDQFIDGVSADLDDFAAHEDLITRARRALDGLDVALIAQGSQADQNASAASVRTTLEEIRTNALSVIALLTLLANDFEREREGVGEDDGPGGTLAVIGSIAGDRGRQSDYVHGAAKGMVAIFMQGLRNRLAKRDIAVLTIKAGLVDSPMTAEVDDKGPFWTSPDIIAKGVVSAVERRRDVVYLPGFWRPIMWALRLIPEPLFKRMNL